MILSRRDPELIKTLFELEVPEIADGLVDIRGVAREPGYRSKIAVESHAQGVDPVGACVGPRGSRVRMVVSELRGEKIDIIPWNPEPARFVAKALSPARVREVYLDDEAKEATVVVPDDQLALAIGKEGMNARLAHRLTGWKIDIVSDTEFAQQEADAAYGGGEPGDEGDTSGRCAAILSTASAARTRRCPARSTAACRPTRSSRRARRSTTRIRTSSSTEPEPELEALADESPSETVSVDGDVLGEPEPGEAFPAGPGRRSGRRPRRDARVRRPPVVRVVDDPERRRADRVRRCGGRRGEPRRVTRSGPARAAAARRRRPSSSASTRVERTLAPGAGAGRGVYTCRRLACFERASTRRAFNRTLRRTVVVDPGLARLYT